jgi:hypothetical protein
VHGTSFELREVVQYLDPLSMDFGYNFLEDLQVTAAPVKINECYCGEVSLWSVSRFIFWDTAPDSSVTYSGR